MTACGTSGTRPVCDFIKFVCVPLVFAWFGLVPFAVIRFHPDLVSFCASQRQLANASFITMIALLVAEIDSIYKLSSEGSVF
jgi:hypothetical protein